VVNRCCLKRSRLKFSRQRAMCALVKLLIKRRI